MPTNQDEWGRLAVITDLAERMKRRKGEFGRTALMKFAYFLQSLRSVPLKYSFTLHSYGPFDSDVLDDLSYLEGIEAISETTIHYPSGYGYDIKPSESAPWVRERGADFLAKYEQDIDWVVNAFGKRTAGDLELISTLIYAEREVTRKGDTPDLAEIVRTVREIKPHFTLETVMAKAEELKRQGLLQAV